jgi:hypothetical protein
MLGLFFAFPHLYGNGRMSFVVRLMVPACANRVSAYRTHCLQWRHRVVGTTMHAAFLKSVRAKICVRIRQPARRGCDINGPAAAASEAFPAAGHGIDIERTYDPCSTGSTRQAGEHVSSLKGSCRAIHIGCIGRSNRYSWQTGCAVGRSADRSCGTRRRQDATSGIRRRRCGAIFALSQFGPGCSGHCAGRCSAADGWCGRGGGCACPGVSSSDLRPRPCGSFSVTLGTSGKRSRCWTRPYSRSVIVRLPRKAGAHDA